MSLPPVAQETCLRSVQALKKIEMIADYIRNAALYHGLGPGLGKALRYLAGTDFSNSTPGRVDLDGDSVYAVISQYTTRPASDARWEAHRKYIDVQYLAAGREKVAVADMPALRPFSDYDETNDIQFFEGAGWEFPLNGRTFAIFFPHDAHIPGIADGAPAMVKKVVVKVRV